MFLHKRSSAGQKPPERVGFLLEAKVNQFLPLWAERSDTFILVIQQQSSCIRYSKPSFLFATAWRITSKEVWVFRLNNSCAKTMISVQRGWQGEWGQTCGKQSCFIDSSSGDEPSVRTQKIYRLFFFFVSAVFNVYPKSAMVVMFIYYLLIISLSSIHSPALSYTGSKWHLNNGIRQN